MLKPTASQRFFHVLTLALGLTIAGTAMSFANEPTKPEDPDALPQALVEILKNPETMPKAETIFYQNCAYCHGSQGVGGKARSLQCRNFKPDYLFDTITNGRRRGANIMPPWKDSLGEAERWKLVAYIMSFSELPGCKK